MNSMTMKPPREESAPALVIKAEALDQMHRLAGTASKVELANAIGADPADLAMVATGQTSPSPALIARIIVAFPEMSFASLCAMA